MNIADRIAIDRHHITFTRRSAAHERRIFTKMLQVLINSVTHGPGPLPLAWAWSFSLLNLLGPIPSSKTNLNLKK